MIVNLKDSGQTRDIRLRDRLEVRLPESQVSGYLWDYSHQCPCLQFDDSDYEEKGPARFNGAGERWWRFRAIATGECELVFSLVRPWSKPSPEFKVTVKVDR